MQTIQGHKVDYYGEPDDHTHISRFYHQADYRFPVIDVMAELRRGSKSGCMAVFWKPDDCHCVTAFGSRHYKANVAKYEKYLVGVYSKDAVSAALLEDDFLALEKELCSHG